MWKDESWDPKLKQHQHTESNHSDHIYCESKILGCASLWLYNIYQVPLHSSPILMMETVIHDNSPCHKDRCGPYRNDPRCWDFSNLRGSQNPFNMPSHLEFTASHAGDCTYRWCYFSAHVGTRFLWPCGHILSHELWATTLLTSLYWKQVLLLWKT